MSLSWLDIVNIALVAMTLVVLYVTFSSTLVGMANSREGLEFAEKSRVESAKMETHARLKIEINSMIRKINEQYKSQLYYSPQNQFYRESSLFTQLIITKQILEEYSEIYPFLESIKGNLISIFVLGLDTGIRKNLEDRAFSSNFEFELAYDNKNWELDGINPDLISTLNLQIKDALDFLRPYLKKTGHF